MMKHLRFLFLSMLVMLTGTAFADTVTFNFDDDYATLFPTLPGVSENGVTDGDITEALTATVSGVSLTVSAAEEGKTTPNRIWKASPRLRMYSGTLTISAPGHKITALAISQGKWNDGNVADSGTLTSTSWTGEAESIVLTIAGNTQFKSIVVTLDGEGGGEEPGPGDDPQPAEVVEGTCADVIAGAEGTVFKVKGTVKSITNPTYGNWIMQDETGEINIYGTLDAEGKTKNFASLGINQGDVVTVQGPKKLYGETVELVDVTVLAIEHSGEAPTEPTIEGGTTPETAITVAAALSAIEGMKDGQMTTDNYYVKGIVVNVTEISTANGNATFEMADAEGATATLTVFRAKGLEKKNIDNEDYVQQGDEVIVYGLLQKYVKDETTTPEVASGYIYSLNGKTEAEEQPVEPYDFVGDGSQENPYTVADMLHMAVPESTSVVEGQEQVWVKGIIMGSLNSAGSALLEGENVVASNIALAEAADEADAKNMLPVQLPSGDLRAALNVVDNPANVGKEVLIYGYILKYMSRTGLKNVSDFVLDGQQFTDGIETVAAESADNAPVYNLAGQRVSKAQKGLYIQNGRKFVK